MLKRISLAMIGVVLFVGVSLYAAMTIQSRTTDTVTIDRTHFSEVDEAVADDDTSYVSTNVHADIDQYVHPAFAIPNGATITSVEVIARAGMTAGTGTLQLFTQMTGGIKQHAGHALTTNYALYTYTLALNPETGMAWTEADVEGTGSNALGTG